MTKLLSAPSAVKADTEVVPVSRVETITDLEFINSLKTVMETAHLGIPLYRYYYAACDGKPVCWGRCIVLPEAIYVAGMETLPEYRRRGFASAVMRRMHTDAANSGARLSVLCSTTSGFPLYDRMGYTLLRHMQAFVPQATSYP